jgi:hypothetical protein
MLKRNLEIHMWKKGPIESPVTLYDSLGELLELLVTKVYLSKMNEGGLT